jgi:DNA polymerase I-like protein with 3'-5' exonuclease and polymerase domains
MQQIPSHSALGKHIKRLFVAPKGTLYVKVDYRVHEVRGWSIISQDTALAEVFKAARRLRQTYLKHPTPELAKKVKVEADPHVSNAIYFFNCTAEESLANDKELRNAVKTVVFGLIYQMSLASLAASINKSLEYATKLAGNFQKRFPRGMGWIDTVKREARKLYYAENPLGFRRHLWGYALPTVLSTAKRIYAEMDRRAVNSPIQGMCAQFMAIGLRALDSRLHRIRVKEDREVDIRPCNSVHDSLENVAAYLNILESISLLETSLTSDVERIVKKRHNFDFVVGLEIDIDFGATLADCDTWDGSITQLYTLLLKAVVKQKYELKYDIDVNEVMDIIFIDGWDYAPDWLKEQAITLDWEYQSKRVNKDVETLLSTPSK